jgi:hypothetical protein
MISYIAPKFIFFDCFHMRQRQEPHQAFADNANAVRQLRRLNMAGKTGKSMAVKTPKKPNQKLVRNILDAIHLAVETEYGPQDSARREIEYALNAALLIVDEATRHQSDAQRVRSFRGAAAMFSDLAQTYYIDPIEKV